MKHLLFLLFFLHLPLGATNDFGGDTLPDGSKISLIAPMGILPSGGFLPLRIEVENKGRAEKKWNLVCSSNVNSSYRHLRRGSHDDSNNFTSGFSVVCPPQESRTVELLVPFPQKITSWSGQRGLYVTLSDGARETSSYSFSAEPPGLQHLVISGEIVERFEADLDREFNRSSYRRYRHSSNQFVGSIDVSELPSDWRAYSGYDALALSRQDFLALASGPKTAIDQWVHSGGHLIILNDGKTAPLPGFEEDEVSQGFGLKTLFECEENYDGFSASDFLEVCDRAPEALTEQASSGYSKSIWSVGTELGERTLGTGLLLIALSIYAIIVGPVNLFVWAKRSRRHRLFVTTPIISIVASLLLVAFILVKDGFGGDGARAIAIDVGGPGDTISTVIQEQFTRTGIVLDSDFSLSEELVFTAVPAPETDFNRSGTNTSYGIFTGAFQATNDGWNVEGNFFKSRTEQAQVLKAVRPSREGLELLSKPHETPQVVSSFSYALTDVFFRGRDDKIWTAASIEPGATVTLSLSSEASQVAQIMPTVSRFAKSHKRILESLTYRPGSFCALAKEAPPLETLSSIDWVESPALITGLLIQ